MAYIINGISFVEIIVASVIAGVHFGWEVGVIVLLLGHALMPIGRNK